MQHLLQQNKNDGEKDVNEVPLKEENEQCVLV